MRVRGRRHALRVALAGAALLLATPAWAHVQQGQAAGFLAGLRHPVSGLDHILAMVAVGLWGAQLGAPAIWLLPVTFPVVMAFGGFLGLLGVALPGVEIGIAASGILLGAWWPVRRARPSGWRRRWWASSPSSMATRTGPSSRLARAGCSTAWAS